MRYRLFIAADIDDAARAACAHVAETMRAKDWAARWVAPENYHLTVAFLGGVDDERIAALTAAAREAAVSVRAFDVPLEIVGAFPNARKPRLAWIGPAAAVAAFGALCDAVRCPLAVLGFTFEPHSDAHVTLARSDGRAALPAVEAPQIAPQRIASVTLYASFTERTGARYVVLDRFAFAASPDS
ncbi:MAG: RNA 2',3'-cyclic phosphodiesterase [Candidatus Eremiobacteraeota bacterium]|nr:RNA 2',3'-cyclic phosphodiesterase [Candidatus Eremiobacteraeota bacterium]